MENLPLLPNEFERITFQLPETQTIEKLEDCFLAGWGMYPERLSKQQIEELEETGWQFDRSFKSWKKKVK